MPFRSPLKSQGPACRLAVAALLFAGAAPASAAETISYTYNARGRLIQVNHAGSVNGGVQTVYTLDKADNRIAKTTTRGSGAFVVVPLKGGSIIPTNL